MFGISIPVILAAGVYLLHQAWILTTHHYMERWRKTEHGEAVDTTFKQLAGQYKAPSRYYKSIAWSGFTSIVLSGLTFSATALIKHDVSPALLFITMVNIVVGLYSYSIGSSYVKEYVRREAERLAQDNSTSSHK